MPVHSDTNGIGAQMPTEKYGVGSPFQAGGGGGGGGSGGGSGAATQVLVGGSNTVPKPHSAALLTRGEINVTPATSTNAAAPAIAKRRIMPTIAGLPRVFPDPLLGPEFTPRASTPFTELTIRKLYSFHIGRGVNRPRALRVLIDVERLVRWGITRLMQPTRSFVTGFRDATGSYMLVDSS